MMRDVEPGGLTTRQEKVRDMLATGLTPRQVALALGTSVQNIYKIKARITEREERTA